MDSPIKDVVPQGSAVVIESKVNDGWYAVIYKGVKAMAAEYKLHRCSGLQLRYGHHKGDDVRMRQRLDSTACHQIQLKRRQDVRNRVSGPCTR